MTPFDVHAGFAELFAGQGLYYGTGEGRVVKDALTFWQYQQHFDGKGPGLGVFPLMPDGSIYFGCVDIDEPDPHLGFMVAGLLPGEAFVERTRSGNVHVWTFFAGRTPAWAYRGVAKRVLEALNRPRVEVFPKQDTLRPGDYGNYVNLPCFGDERPIYAPETSWDREGSPEFLSPATFVRHALLAKVDPEAFVSRARAFGLSEPDEQRGIAAFGEQATLHECAAYIYRNRDERPLVEGSRSVVLFNLAKMLLNYRDLTPDEAWQMLTEVNDAAQPSLPRRELRRMLASAASKGYTSTGCDDPLMADYVSPTCPIAHPELAK